ncbi:hypothetical protein BS50DRAFT_555225 [Corynespora cassiicola Philippines]|uniref:ML-like domain-containing protein n=1 Tax=Corynespora cassiicola Philippines TaxID=1448308 RepID=A0A2T2NIT8_CORCC|nr:hypothetical protein BS50DRAFT_555225 [Corynespora cassiicola Philippines]
MTLSMARRCAYPLPRPRQRHLPSLQPTQPPPRPRRKHLSTFVMFLFALAALLPVSNAVFVTFDNCLSRGYRFAQDPPRLQFYPVYVWAAFDTSSPSHNLNITIYGNVSGQASSGNYPSSDNAEYWNDPNQTLGKIVDVSRSNNKYTTLFQSFRMLTYSAYTAPAAPFCRSTVNTSCPISPAFDANLTNYWELPAFTIGHDFYSSYSFATIASTARIVSGDAPTEGSDPTTLACISTNITPDLGARLSGALRYLPAAILALVAFATVFAATYSPWGTTNIFRWTSNSGRDEDLLRLVTPGFGDCLQYIQFIVLAGSLNLNYPGFFQPVISQASWSVLMFNESFVSQGNGSQTLIDGIYFTNSTYGLSRLGEYVGMSEERDIWAGMAVWLLAIIAAVIVLVQLGFVGRWIYRLTTNSQDPDLRGKNWSFTAGNVVRIIFNFFMLPIIALSLFQLVVAERSPGSVIATAVVLLVGVMSAATWIFWFIFTTRPRAHLFDDLPTVLTYGPLYNTYSDDAAPFAFIPVLLNTIRGIAIGAIQPSGIAQIIVLAICEVILILTLHAFRPFQSNTSMNAYHTFFSVVRLTCILLMIAFVPNLNVSEAPKGWIGYSILLLHAFVLVFGFFLNALQTIIEVGARLAGAGGEQRGGLTKVFGKRQLSKRTRAHRHQRSSLNSNAAMLAHDENKHIQLMGGRARSLSGSSAVLLNNHNGSQRASLGFDQFSQGAEMSNYGGGTPGTPGTNATPFSYLGGGSGQSSRRPTMGAQLDAADPYFRAPRPRKHTMDSLTPGVQGRETPYADNVDEAEIGDVGEGPSSWSPNRSSITPAYLKMHRDDSDPNLERRNNTDYSVRESDFYYGLRGPALSAQPTRKLKTGPADPMGPVSSATGWFKSLGLFAGKKKEKGKGFEVVRSTRIPPQMMPLEEDDESPHAPQEPYRDSPNTPPTRGSPKRTSPGSGTAAAAAAATAAMRRSNDSDSDDSRSDDDSIDYRGERISDMAPTLGPIETGGGIELPSRIGSRASHNPRQGGRPPNIPRKSSRRTGSTGSAVLDSSSRLSTVMASSAENPRRTSQHLQPNPGGLPIRLPFGSSEPSPSPERSPGHSAASSMYHNDRASDLEQLDAADTLQPPRTIQTGERPLSTGYVHKHVARDSIQTERTDAGAHLEASAEIVDRSRSISTQGSGNANRSR